MIVDDHHGLGAVLGAAAGTPGSPTYLDARIPSIMHLRLVSALLKPTGGRMSRQLLAVARDPSHRAALVDLVASPREGTLAVLDDRPLAAAIGGLTSEPGVSLAFAALIAHAQSSGQPIPVASANEGRWMDVARRRGVEVVARVPDIS